MQIRSRAPPPRRDPRESLANDRGLDSRYERVGESPLDSWSCRLWEKLDCIIHCPLVGSAGAKVSWPSFFCKRDDENLREPRVIIPTIVSHLATVHRLFAKAVAIALQEDPDLGKSAIMLQFKGIIEGPLVQVARSSVTGRMVVVIDALDECGTEGTRRQLLVKL